MKVFYTAYSTVLLFVTFCEVTANSQRIRFADNWYHPDAIPSNLDVVRAYGKRSGTASTTHSCNHIRSVPKSLNFIRRNYYKKYTEAYGIPIISSIKVSDNALKRACYIVRFLFADRNDVRQGIYKNFGRFGVIGVNERTTDIPEFSHLPNWWNQRARGLGGVLGRPISTGGEENLLCQRNDRYRGDDIYFHESAHNVAEVALAGALPHMYRRLGQLYQSARRAGKWRNTYAMTDQREYFAEGLQSYFNNHIEGSNPPNGVHGPINTRAELRLYDNALYRFIKELYPCQNTYELCTINPNQQLRMNCDGSKPQPKTTYLPPPPGGKTTPTTTTTTTTKKPTTSNCTDNNRHCRDWTRYWPSYCRTNHAWQNCRRSCRFCR